MKKRRPESVAYLIEDRVQKLIFLARELRRAVHVSNEKRILDLANAIQGHLSAASGFTEELCSVQPSKKSPGGGAP